MRWSSVIGHVSHRWTAAAPPSAPTSPAGDSQVEYTADGAASAYSSSKPSVPVSQGSAFVQSDFLEIMGNASVVVLSNSLVLDRSRSARPHFKPRRCSGCAPGVLRVCSTLNTQGAFCGCRDGSISATTAVNILSMLPLQSCESALLQRPHLPDPRQSTVCPYFPRWFLLGSAQEPSSKCQEITITAVRASAHKPL